MQGLVGGAGAKSVSQGLALVYFTAHGPLWNTYSLVLVGTQLLVRLPVSVLYSNYLILLQKE